MLVKDLVKFTYDSIIIYTSVNDDYTEFEDLYIGERDNIPDSLLSMSVRAFGAKENLERTIDIWV